MAGRRFMLPQLGVGLIVSTAVSVSILEMLHFRTYVGSTDDSSRDELIRHVYTYVGLLVFSFELYLV